MTLFLGDVRIATNVMLDAGTRALGTRVSREVYEKVLERGERFADRAFVVNDWYLSAYDPIRDPEGRVVGIIYVGLLEKAYLQYRAGLAREYLAVSLLAVLLSVVAAFLISSGMRRPVARLVEATRQVAAGNLDARVPAGRGGQELVELAQAFNSMAETPGGAQAGARGGCCGAAEGLLRGGGEEPRLPRDAGLRDPRAQEPAGLDRLRHRLAARGNPGAAQRGPAGGAARGRLTPPTTCRPRSRTTSTSAGSRRASSRSSSRDVPLHRAASSLPLLERLSELAAERGMRLVSDVDDGRRRCGATGGSWPRSSRTWSRTPIKYGRAGGRIRVQASRAPDAPCTCSVWNEGPGFAAGDADRLFRRFSRLRADRSDTKPGTGLGPLRLAPDRRAARRAHLGGVGARPVGALQLHAPRRPGAVAGALTVAG